MRVVDITTRIMMNKYLRNVLIGILFTVLSIFVIFTASSVSYKLKENHDIFYISDNEDDSDNNEYIMKIFTWANEPDEFGNEIRQLSELELSASVYTGNLYGKRSLYEILGEYSDESYKGICVYSQIDRDFEYTFPIITIEYDGKIECKYSADIGEGWLYYGKSKNYMLDGEKTRKDATASGNGFLTVCPRVFGIFAYEDSMKSCSEKMQEYNEVREVYLLDVCPELPTAMNRRVGKEYTMHIFVTAYDSVNTEKVNASADIEITCYSPEYILYKDLLLAGYEDLLMNRNLNSFIKINLAEYEQIEITK